MYNLGFSRIGNDFASGRARIRASAQAPQRYPDRSINEVPMYAVIKTGGKQYKVAAGEKLKVEQIPADIGSEITLDQVLAVGAGETIKFGSPLVQGAKVLATVVAQGRHDKVKIFKMRRRKHYQKRQGHRQNYTELQIVSING
jgi:large subunit ribosomal protein L21